MNTKSCSATPRSRGKLGFHFDHTKTPSVSSSSSSSSNSNSSSYSFYFTEEEEKEASPLSPCSTPLKLISGVPFSWEKLPGIAKSNSSDVVVSAKEETTNYNFLLPLPPPSSSTTPRKQSKLSSPEGGAQWDPFMAALVECSRDNDRHRGQDHREGRTNGISWGGVKVSRSISDRFGLVSMYGSCKRISAVSHSIIYVPPSTARRPYGHRRSLDNNLSV